jgi:hypothetical protein
MDGLMMEIHI